LHNLVSKGYNLLTLQPFVLCQPIEEVIDRDLRPIWALY